MLDGPVDGGGEDQVHFADKLGEITAEALLEAEEAVEGIILGHVARHAAEIVDAALRFDRPLDHAPL